jgi:hypothetical protein
MPVLRIQPGKSIYVGDHARLTHRIFEGKRFLEIDTTGMHDYAIGNKVSLYIAKNGNSLDVNVNAASEIPIHTERSYLAITSSSSPPLLEWTCSMPINSLPLERTVYLPT